jgi:sec-independent protein translocase protein TatB
MLDIGWTELLVIAIVAIIVVGPKDLPRLMRNVGNFAGRVRRMASEFRYQFEEAARESEFEEVRKSFHSMHQKASDFDLNRTLGLSRDDAYDEGAGDEMLPLPDEAAPAPAKLSKPRATRRRRRKSAVKSKPRARKKKP